jgi:hypothetical protein
MTSEQRTFVEAGDLSEVELCCDACKTRVSCPLDKPFSVPNACPSCNAPWLHQHKQDERKEALYRFFESLKVIRGLKSVPFQLRFRVHTERLAGT